MRYDQVNISKEHRSFKTKPQLATEILKQDVYRGVEFDWVGGD
jgi:hypothetical protein